MFATKSWFFSIFSAVFLVFSLADAEPPKDSAKVQLSEEEKAFLELANQARAKAKLPPLTVSAALLAAAREHAANMAAKSEMNHVLDGKDTAHRVRSHGYEFEKVAENIAACEKNNAAEVFRNWMECQHNKDNVLNDEFKELGIGIAKSEKGETYYALVFATPRPKH